MPFAFDTATRRADAALLFSRLATYSLGVLALLTAGMIALTDVVVRLILPPNFHDAAAVVPILALGIAAQSAGWFPTTSLNVAKATRYYPIVTGIAAAASVLSQIALIPRAGVFGAATGAAIGQAVQALATLLVAQRVYPIPYERVRLVKIVAVGAITTIVAVLITFENPLVTAVARTVVVLACFPAGLFLTRLFTTSEIRDLRTLADTVRTRLRPIPPELPS
jgi:O-antigen/teichoic acid export membrane protein